MNERTRERERERKGIYIERCRKRREIGTIGMQPGADVINIFRVA